MSVVVSMHSDSLETFQIYFSKLLDHHEDSKLYFLYRQLVFDGRASQAIY